MNSFYSQSELRQLNLKACGTNVLISRKASIYGAENIVIGSDVRVDDYCILSGKIELGNHIHIAAYSALYGGSAGITICDYANISARVCIYAISDDYSGHTMTNPTIPDKYKHIQNEPVSIGKHVIIGSGCVVLPGVVLPEGSALGAMTLMKETAKPWMIYGGIPAKEIKKRSKALLDLEKQFLCEENKQEEPW